MTDRATLHRIDRWLHEWGHWARQDLATGGAPHPTAQGVQLHAATDKGAEINDRDYVTDDYMDEPLCTRVNIALYQLCQRRPLAAGVLRMHYRDGFEADIRGLRRAQEALRMLLS